MAKIKKRARPMNSRDILIAFLRSDYGRWAYDRGLLEHQPCSQVHYATPDCPECARWQKQDHELMARWRDREPEAPVEKNARKPKPKRAKPAPPITPPRSSVPPAPRQQIDAPVFSLGREIERDPALRGYIYLVTNPIHDGWVKVGSTVDLGKRLSSYQTSGPLRRFELVFYAEVDDRLAVEKWVRHSLARTHACNNEWVECSLEDALATTKIALAALGLTA